MEIFQEFGVDPILLAAQIVNFLIIAYILKRFAYKPILKLLDERKKTVELGLKQAEEAKKLLEQANEKETALLKSAQAASKKMQEEAKKQRDEILKQTEADVRAKTDKMLLEAKEKIAQETKDAEKRLEKQVTELSMAFLEKAVSGLFTPADQKAVLEKAAKSIDKQKMKS